MHRAVFHFEPDKGLGARLHWIIHGVHHDHPNDPMRLVMPPSVSVPLATLFLLAFWTVLDTPIAFAFGAGFLSGYLVYDMLHFHLHHHVPRTRLGRGLRELHMRHHFQDDTRGYGISAPFWDHVFRTVPVRSRDVRGRSAAAAAPPASRSARPRERGAVGALARPDAADRDGRPGRPVGLPLLRGRLRPAGLRQGRAGHPDRGRSRQPDLARPAVPEGLGHQAAASTARCARPGQVPAPGRHASGRSSTLDDGDGHDRRPGHRDPRPRLGGHRRRTASAAAPHARASPASAARRSTTRRTTSSRSCSRRSARSRSRTRPAYDTPPPSPVWGPRSGAAAPPPSSRTSRTPTAS